MWPFQRISTAPRSPRSRSFSCSSFKDIHSLCDNDPWQQDSHSPISSPRSYPSVFHRFRISASDHHHSSFPLCHANSLPTAASLSKIPDKPITLYFTSLRVVRKTFEDCRAVRSILRGYRVPIDERDLSMDSQYVTELQEILGCRNGKSFAIPCVFIGRCCVGGAEEVNRLHESGELKAMIVGSPPPGTSAECGACGGLRYVVCEECHGGRKIYVDKSGGFRSCKACNVNGLIRCTQCMGLIGPYK